MMNFGEELITGFYGENDFSYSHLFIFNISLYDYEYIIFPGIYFIF